MSLLSPRPRPGSAPTCAKHRWTYRSISANLSKPTSTLKLENLQYTGSFKARGAINKLLSLDATIRGRGVVAASSGNHGAAVAYGAYVLGVPALIFVPEQTSSTKLAAMARYGAQVTTLRR